MIIKLKLLTIIVLLAIFLPSCVIIQPGTVGVKRRLGRLSKNIMEPGVHPINPFITATHRVTVRTQNLEVKLDLPSKEGLTIQSEISILYHLDKSHVPNIIETIGMNYERAVVFTVFRSAAADVCSRFMAKDMHSGERAVIEGDIAKRMDEVLRNRGFVIEQVLLKSIKLPEGLARSIEQKLQAEQDAQRMHFLLERERQEAERRKIEAEGTRNAQKILAEGLIKEIIQLRSIEAFLELAKSPNTKVIITDGKAPYLIQE
jgi:prohibitin 1